MPPCPRQHNICRTEDLDEHQHVDGIHGAVHAAPVDRADVVSRSPVKRQFDPHLAPVSRDIGYPSAGAAIGRDEVESPARDPFLSDSGMACVSPSGSRVDAPENRNIANFRSSAASPALF